MTCQSILVLSQKNQPKKFKFKSFQQFKKRGELLKKKQILLSWLELYRNHESKDSFKPENMRYLKTYKVKQEIESLDEELNTIEQKLNLHITPVV